MNPLRQLLNRLAAATRGTTQNQRSPVRPAVEGLEDRLVPTTLSTTVLQTKILPYTPPQIAWLQSNMTDAGLRSLTQSDFARDSALTRADMLGIFTQVEADNVVSSAELNDLRTLYVNGAYLNMPAAVRDLTFKVVYSDPGNSTYQAMVTTYVSHKVGLISYVSPVQVFEDVALGNLNAGSSATQLSELVNKWFLGMDLPTVVTSSTSYAYDSAGTLFGAGNTINYTDITQGTIGDCYLMSALADLANQSPSTIRNMITDNGDGTYTVQFMNGSNADYVTVNRWLPVNSSSQFVYADYGQSISDSTAKLWVPLLEKAYAQLNHSGWIGRDNVNSYGHLDSTGLPTGGINIGWAGVVLPQITGLSASYGNTLNKTNFTNAVTDAQLVCLSTPQFYDSHGNKVTTKVIDGFTVVSDHEYAVVAYNSTSGKFTAFNPWGVSATNVTTLPQLTWTQITDIFNSWDAGNNPSWLLSFKPIWLTATGLTLIGTSSSQGLTANVTAAAFAAEVTTTLPAVMPAPKGGIRLLPGAGLDQLDPSMVDVFFAQPLLVDLLNS